MENLISNAGAENIQPESAKDTNNVCISSKQRVYSEYTPIEQLDNDSLSGKFHKESLEKPCVNKPYASPVNNADGVLCYYFNGNPLRATKDKDGQVWVCAKDVCDTLGYKNTSKAISDHCRGVTLRYTLQTSGGTQEVLMISEPDLMRLTCRSKMPDAVRFEKWVFEEVLPEIRKNGGYIHTSPEMSDDEIMARALQVAQRTIDRKNMVIEEQTRQLALQAPAVEYCNEVLSAENLHTVNSIAVHLGISARKLNEFLIDADWIYKQGGIYCPSCKIRNKGYCDYHIVPYFNSQGGKETREHLKWTENGRKAIIDLWQKRHSA